MDAGQADLFWGISVEGIAIDIGELVALGATDSELYARTFFPKTFRQTSPKFHADIWQDLEDPTARLVNIRAFRGSAKTTICRTFSSKRIAYGLSRTILYVGASEAHAIRSINWLRTQVEKNKLWAQTFGLRPGRKWQEAEIEIIQSVPRVDGGVDEHTIWVLGVGITGNIRGINFDDYRPDLIVCDDIVTDENSATAEQREKVSNLVFGALKGSLASMVEEPNAKLALLTTPQHQEDVASAAQADEAFRTVSFPCWTKETMHLPLDEQVSCWPELFPTEPLRQDKRFAMMRNKLSTFTREMEVRLISLETAAFRHGWLNIEPVYPAHLPFCVLAIDPVPPPSDRERAKGMEGKDYEAHIVIGRDEGRYFIMDYAQNRGHDPNWSINQFFTFAYKYRIARCIVETVAYQRTLKWILEQEMQRRRQYYSIIPFNDRRSKSTRIISTYSGIASSGLLNIRPEHTEFATQFYDFSEMKDGVDDLLDAGAMALSDLINPALERGGGMFLDSDVEPIEFTRRCP